MGAGHQVCTGGAAWLQLYHDQEGSPQDGAGCPLISRLLTAVLQIAVDGPEYRNGHCVLNQNTDLGQIPGSLQQVGHLGRPPYLNRPPVASPVCDSLNTEYGWLVDCTDISA
eukprot:365488-Chlamydomonas_euryale.AAC.3